MRSSVTRNSVTSHRAMQLAFAVGAILASAQSMAAEGGEGTREIVVTARKAPERLLDVPLSVSAFVSDDLQETASRDIYDLTRMTPGFSFERLNRYGVQGGVSRPVIRGMSNILGDGNASVFVDGIQFSDSILSFPFDIVDRVEIIKGPQAALFGRATFAGAINLVTKKGTNTPDNRVSVRGAQYGDYETNLLSRGALIQDKLFYMVHGRYYTFDGMYRNTLDGGKIGDEESYNFDASLEYRPGDVFSATLSGGFSHDDDGLATVVAQDRFANNCFLNVPRQYYCGEIKEKSNATLDRATLAGNEGIDRESIRVSSQLEWDLGSFKIVSNSGAFFTDQDYGYDSTYLGATLLGPTTVPNAPGFVRPATDQVRTGNVMRIEATRRDEFSSELRAQSDEGRFHWLGGLFYYQSRRSFEERHFAATAPTVFSGETQIDNMAVFGSLGYDITTQFDVKAEVRYAEDKIGNLKTIPTRVLIDKTFDSLSPRFSLRYKLAPDSMIYTSAARGNKPGVINADPRFPTNLQFADEEEAWSYELGTKNRVLGGKLEVNAAAYYIDWTNQQITSVFTFPVGGTQSYVSNAAKSEVKGVELEVQAALTENLLTGFTYSYTDAEFVRLEDGEARELFGNSSVKGKQLPGVPQQQGSIFGKVLFDFGTNLQGYTRVDASYTDRKFDQIYNLAHTGYQKLVNLTVGLDSEHWGAQLFVRNLTDDRTPSSVNRYVDQLNLNVPQVVNANPAQNNVPGSTTTERAYFFSLPMKRQVGASITYRF